MSKQLSNSGTTRSGNLDETRCAVACEPLNLHAGELSELASLLGGLLDKVELMLRNQALADNGATAAGASKKPGRHVGRKMEPKAKPVRVAPRKRVFLRKTATGELGVRIPLLAAMPEGFIDWTPKQRDQYYSIIEREVWVAESCRANPKWRDARYERTAEDNSSLVGSMPAGFEDWPLSQRHRHYAIIELLVLCVRLRRAHPEWTHERAAGELERKHGSWARKNGLGTSERTIRRYLSLSPKFGGWDGRGLRRRKGKAKRKSRRRRRSRGSDK